MKNSPRITIVRAAMVLAILWGASSYFVAEDYFHTRIAELVARDTQEAQVDADDLADSIRRNLHYLSGIPDTLAHLTRVNLALSRFGADVAPSALLYDVRKQRWTADPTFNDLSRFLAIVQDSLGADLVYVVNAAGDSIAASNWDTPGTTIGSNYAERDFFRKNRAGQRGMQYAVGKTTHIAGLYFSSPVIINGKFMGAVVAKVDVPRLSFLTKLTDAFVTDKNGVIILAHDAPMEMKALPDAPLRSLSQQEIFSYYQRDDFKTLQIRPWGSGEFAAVQRIDGEYFPRVLASRELPELGLTTHVENALPAMLELENERSWLPLLLSLVGSLLIALGGMAVYYLQAVKSASEELRNAQNRLGDMLHASMDAIISINAKQDIVYFNTAAEQMFGYPAARAIGRPLDSLIPAEFRTAHARHIEAFGKTGATARSMNNMGTVFGLRANGEQFPVEASITQSTIGGNKYYTVILRDVTLRKQAEEKLLESERNYRELMEQAADSIFVADHEGLRYLDANRAACDMLGYTREELLALGPRDLIHPDDIKAAPIRIAELQAGHAIRSQRRFRCKDGSLVYVELNARMLSDGRLQSVARNVTDRRLVEEILHKREEQYHAVIETSVDGFWMADAQGRLLEVNSAYERMSGYRREELLAMGIPNLEVNEKPEETAAHIEKIINTGYDRFETRHRRKDGSIWPVEVVTTFWRKGGLFFVFLVDITWRKQDEKKIRFLTQSYAAQSQVNHALIESVDEVTLFNKICQITVELGGMELAWVGVNEQSSGRIHPVAVYGEHQDYLRDIVVSSRADLPEGRGPAGTVFRERRSIFTQDAQTSPSLAHWRDRISKYGWGSSGAVPIVRGGKSYAVLVFYHATEHVFTDEIIGLFNDMADNIGRGLDRLDLEAEKRKTEESMLLAAAIYKSSSEAVMVTDEDNRIVDINPAFTRITGYTLEEVLGKNPNILQSGKHDEEFYRAMWQAIKNESGWQGEIWDKRKDGELYAKWATISVLRHADGSVYRHVAQFSDITEKKRQDELIQRQASYDMLTGLPNRRLFQDRLEHEIKRADDNRAGSPLALLYLDLDHFKEINDTLGHAQGDVLLVEAARRISECVRETDTVARLGGDEFAVILPEMGDRAQLERVATCIIDTLTEPFSLGGDHIGYVSASVGITLYPDDARDMESLLKHADQAMYVAKAAGRSRYGYFTESMQQSAREKLALTNDLRHALARKELHVYYQPILEMESGDITKAEALLRWQHPTRGIIGPAVFIPLAEEAGLIHEIGGWVFQQAVAQVAAWRKLYGRIIQVSVNKSPMQFEQPEIHNWSEQMKKLGLPGNGITVEITEGLLVKESSKAKEQLLEFRNNGIEVSIDDFGTGFSSLSYLKQFDIDYLKIDKSFIKDLHTNQDDKALTEAIIVMAHKLGIKTIAEGVETEAQRDLLKSFGCDYVQGYLYSPAVLPKEFGRMLENKE